MSVFNPKVLAAVGAVAAVAGASVAAAKIIKKHQQKKITALLEEDLGHGNDADTELGRFSYDSATGEFTEEGSSSEREFTEKSFSSEKEKE